MAEQKIKDWRRAAKATIHAYPEIKEKTKEATNSDPWGPTDAQKAEIAEAAFNGENRAIILKALWKRVAETDEYWMHVYKALDVLEYLFLVDVPGIAGELKFHEQMISHLLLYAHAKHKDSAERDHLNDKVRLKAKRMKQLMENPEFLQSERQKLRVIMARLTGVADRSYVRTSLEEAAASSPHPVPSSRALPPAAKKPYHSHGGGVRVSTSPAPNGGEKEFEIDMDVLSTMMDMGFTDQDAVIQALLAADNDLDRACEYILKHPNGGRLPSTSPPPTTAAPPTTQAAVAPSSTQAQPSPQPPRDLFGEHTPTAPPTRSATNLFDEPPSLPPGRRASATVSVVPSAPPTSTRSVAPANVAASPSLWEAQPASANRPQGATFAAQPPVAFPPPAAANFDPFAEAVTEHLERPASNNSLNSANSTTNSAPMDFFSDSRPVQRPAPPPVMTAKLAPSLDFGDVFGPSNTAPPAMPPAPASRVLQSNTPPPTAAAGEARPPASLEDKMLFEFHTMGQPKLKKPAATLDQLVGH